MNSLKEIAGLTGLAFIANGYLDLVGGYLKTIGLILGIVLTGFAIYRYYLSIRLYKKKLKDESS